MNFTTFNFRLAHRAAPVLAGLTLALGGGVLVASAQTYTPLAPLPIGEGGATPTTYTLTSYLTGAIKLLIAVAGALAILMTIIAGTQYVAAGINPSAKSDARSRINNALIGLVLVLTSYLLLRSIDPRLVEFNLMLPPVGQTSAAPQVTAPSAQAPSTQSATSRLRSGGTNPRIQPPVSAPSTPVVTPAPTPTPTPDTSLANSIAQTQQNARNARINRYNDYSIISNCIGNTSYDLCPRTDLNGDGVVNITDVSLFGRQGHSFDVNQNNTIELEDAYPAVSCFFKVSSTNVQSMLPVEVPSDGAPTLSCGGSGRIVPPSATCNGATWLKESVLAPRCAVANGLSSMPFGFVYGGGSQFSQFQSWVTGAAQGSAVSLTTLFEKTFFRQVQYSDSFPQNEYFESDLGKLTYTTVAAYDLNNDGTADFSSSGLDMTAFDACRGSSASGSCAQADFNQDGAIDTRDLALANFMRSDVLGGSASVLLGWYLNWFESMLFDPTGYIDKQVISYCLNRTAFEKCASADVNGDRVVDNADLTTFNQTAPTLDFNGDGKVDLRL